MPVGLPDVILREDDEPGELGEPAVVVAEVEARVAERRAAGMGGAGCRARAAELHREAERLYYG